MWAFPVVYLENFCLWTWLTIPAVYSALDEFQQLHLLKRSISFFDKIGVWCHLSALDSQRELANILSLFSFLQLYVSMYGKLKDKSIVYSACTLMRSDRRTISNIISLSNELNYYFFFYR